MNSTVAEALKKADPELRQVSDTPGTDAQLLLGEVLGQSRPWILAHPEYNINSSDQARFEAILTAVIDGAALPHVLGWWEFYGRRFFLDQSVLIPRPETELMVETALSLAAPNAKILDIGTGSGCIAVTLALELPEVRIYASDLSWSALQVARRNVSAYQVEHAVRLVSANLTDPFAGSFDLICANLPYVAAEQLPQLAVASREPTIALDGGHGGTELIYRVLETLPRILAPGGLAFFEIDPDQADGALKQANTSLESCEAWIKNDLAGFRRLMVLRRD